jgi:cell division initiation protein
MDLTPIDLKKQEFKRVVRGYDPLQVRRFLDEVAEVWEGLIRAQQETRARVAELGETIENYRRMERTLNETLIAAQRIAEESRETSLKESEIIRKEAEMEGRRAVGRAEAEARGLEEQIRELRVQRDSLFLKLRNLMEEELLRLHALRDLHADLPASRSVEPSLSPPESGERRSILPPPPAARELVQRPVRIPGMGRELSEEPAWDPAFGYGERPE